MGVKVYDLKYVSGKHYAWAVQCPACGHSHSFDDRWKYDGNHEAPTFDGSMLADAGGNTRCHSYMRKGVWEYLNDCKHAFAGKKVPAPDWNLQPATTPAPTKDPEPATKSVAEPPPTRVEPPASTYLSGMRMPTVEEQEAFRARTDRLFAALQAYEVALPREGASLLCAHLFATSEASHHMGATEAIVWTRSFKARYPKCWHWLRLYQVEAFAKELLDSDLDSVSPERLAVMACVIRGAPLPTIEEEEPEPAADP
jgi:hypothetical protein